MPSAIPSRGQIASITVTAVVLIDIEALAILACCKKLRPLADRAWGETERNSPFSGAGLSRFGSLLPYAGASKSDQPSERSGCVSAEAGTHRGLHGAEHPRMQSRAAGF